MQKNQEIQWSKCCQCYDSGDPGCVTWHGEAHSAEEKGPHSHSAPAFPRVNPGMQLSNNCSPSHPIAVAIITTWFTLWPPWL